MSLNETLHPTVLKEHRDRTYAEIRQALVRQGLTPENAETALVEQATKRANALIATGLNPALAAEQAHAEPLRSPTPEEARAMAARSRSLHMGDQMRAGFDAAHNRGDQHPGLSGVYGGSLRDRYQPL